MRYILLAGLFLLSTTAAAAGWDAWEHEFDDEKPWVELQAQIPAYPKLEEAIAFFVSGATENKFFIDPKSISVGADDVVRYTLIVKSPEGVVNITFEGIACRTQEVKLYAFGRTDGTWSRNRYAKWSPIEYKDRNRQHHMLYDDFFCPGGMSPRDADEAVYGLKQGIHPRAKR